MPHDTDFEKDQHLLGGRNITRAVLLSLGLWILLFAFIRVVVNWFS